MTQRRSTIVSAVVLAALVSLRPDVMSQNRDTLETEVTAAGNEIVFKWSKRHPWDADLIARGASLWAEYQTARSAGLECMQEGSSDAAARGMRGAPRGSCFSGTTVMRSEDRAIRFKLPDSLAAEPTGPVCLQLRLTDQRIIPIRRATREGGDTARFQYERWSQGAARRAQLATLERRRIELQTAIAQQSSAISEQAASNLRQKWASAEACNDIAETSVELAPSIRPTAVPSIQDEVARSMCVIRLNNGYDILQPSSLTAFLADADPALVERWRRVRQRQLDAYVSDWQRLSPKIDAFKASAPVPYFGTYKDTLPLQSLTVDAAVRVLGARKAKTAPESIDVFGLIGGAIEAYDRCVSDGKQQLDLNYRQGQSLKATVQTLPSRIRAQDVRECQTAVTRLDAMTSRLTQYQQQLAALEQDIAKVSISQPGSARVNLNAVACTP